MRISARWEALREFLKANGKDVVIFAMSLLLAFAIWLIHNLTTYYNGTLRVPLAVNCNIDGHSNKSSQPPLLALRCHMTGFEIIRFNNYTEKSPLALEVNTEDMHPAGGEIYYMTTDDIAKYAQNIMGSSSSVLGYISDTLWFKFPLQNSKKVPVSPICNMSFAPQYMAVGELKMIPDSVTIYGEPGHLDNVDRIYTNPFKMEELSSFAHGIVKLELMNGIRASADRVEYTLNVSRFVEVTEEIPVSAVNVPSDRVLIIYPSTVKVTMQCAFPLLFDPAEEVGFNVDYDVFSTSLSGKVIPQPSSLPDGVLGYSIEPQVVDCVEGYK